MSPERVRTYVQHSQSLFRRQDADLDEPAAANAAVALGATVRRGTGGT
jgi:hypothetical protein